MFCVQLVFGLLALASFPAPTGATADNYDSAGERELVRRLNEERVRAGLPALASDDRLTEAARVHAKLMADRSQLSHQFPGEPAVRERLAEAKLRFNASGENVAYDSDIANAHQGLIVSSPHRANILSPKYNAVGIGVVHKGEVIYVAQDFAHILETYSVQQVQAMISQSLARLRQQRRLQPLREEASGEPELRKKACLMARNDRISAKASDFPVTRAVVAYAVTQPEELVPQVIKMASEPNIQSYALGVCSAASRTYPSGAYWVLVLFK